MVVVEVVVAAAAVAVVLAAAAVAVTVVAVPVAVLVVAAAVVWLAICRKFKYRGIMRLTSARWPAHSFVPLAERVAVAFLHRHGASAF